MAMHRWQARFKRFLHWLFGSPFEDLPPAFGDPVPPELREFEAEAEEAQRHPRGEVTPVATLRHPGTSTHIH